MVSDCKTCSKCKTSLNVSNFYERKRSPGQLQSWCKFCMREQWRMDNQRKRGGLRGYCKVQSAKGSPQEVAQAVIEMARAMRPESEGVRVYRLPCGEVRFWQGAMKPPRDAEPIGVYDFEAKPEYVARDLAA